MDTINARDLTVRFGETIEASDLVKRFHYSRRPAANIRLIATLHEPGGLFGDAGRAIAAACFSIPPTRWSEPVIELSRLVRRDGMRVPLTMLIAHALRCLKRDGVDLVVSYADATEKHHGGVYQAAGWSFNGFRKPIRDGNIINGTFVPCRTLNSLYGTNTVENLRYMFPRWSIEPHFDAGKYLYWRALNKSGRAKAERLNLSSAPYPKPARESA